MNIIAPINFLSEYEFDKHKVRYVHFRELGQGGPEVGKIEINGCLIAKSEYGGPLLYSDNKIYLPVLRGRSFTLCSIDLETLNTTLYEEVTSNIILLKEIKGSIIYFFNKLNNQNLMSYDLSKRIKPKSKKWFFW